MQVSIGVAESGREIDLDVDDVDELSTRIEAALAGDNPTLVWVVDTKGRRIGIPSNRLAYIEIAASERSAVGFGSE